jgi:adenosine/AMP kinase
MKINNYFKILFFIIFLQNIYSSSIFKSIKEAPTTIVNWFLKLTNKEIILGSTSLGTAIALGTLTYYSTMEKTLHQKQRDFLEKIKDILKLSYDNQNKDKLLKIY